MDNEKRVSEADKDGNGEDALKDINNMEKPFEGESEETSGQTAEAEIGVSDNTEAAKESKPVKKRGGKCYLFFKRMFDIISATLLFVIMSPILGICLLAKWLEDFANPIYVSTRVGKDGKEFKFYKIRTMCPHADELKKELIDAGLNEADPPAFKMKKDPRITPVGRFLRRFSLDELPQLLHIISGKMSVVGPRPPLPSEVENYTEEQKKRLSVKGGLLCLWQIQKKRNEITFDDWIKLDLEYIETRSAGLDLKIIFKGLYMVIFDHSGV